MRRSITCLAVALMLAGISAAQAQKKTPVDLELAFVTDASGSIDDAEMRLQRQGYADALTHPEVLSAIGAGFLRSVAVAYIEFAADGCTRLGVPWMKIDGPAAAKLFGDRVLALDRVFCPGGNAIGEAVGFAQKSLTDNAYEGTRRVIDVSGDGPNTLAPPVEWVRDLAIAQGTTINGLVIDRPSMPDLYDYFRYAVTGGPRSFVIKAENRRVFAEAILKKMILEIAGTEPPSRHAAR